MWTELDLGHGGATLSFRAPPVESRAIEIVPAKADHVRESAHVGRRATRAMRYAVEKHALVQAEDTRPSGLRGLLSITAAGVVIAGDLDLPRLDVAALQLATDQAAQRADVVYQPVRLAGGQRRIVEDPDVAHGGE